MARLPLEGIKVIDHGIVYTGTAANAILADMGAEVIRVESIGRFPSMTRGYRPRPAPGLAEYPGYVDGDPGDRPWDRWFQLHAINRNKLGITLELNRPEGIEVYHKLVRRGDMVIENFSQGTMDRLGLGYEELKKVNPKIIMISASGLGKEGPYKGYSTFGTNLDAITGMTILRGYPDSDYTERDMIPVWSDNVAASTVAFAALVALHYREKTGKGQFIDLSQAEGFLPHMGEAVMDYTMNGRTGNAIGNRDMSYAPQGCYRCSGEDRWVTISVTSDTEWQAFCTAIGNPDWTKDTRFTDALSRWKNQDAMDTFIGEWTVEHDPYEVMHIMQAAGVAAGPVLSPADEFLDPHLNERGFFHELNHREAGTHRYPGMFFKFSKTPADIRIPPNCLGEHNDYVYGELLGMSREEIDRLEEQHIIGTEYLEDA
ncbi:MAG TPA: CoA transferase [Dehalococcoidia bacterium]|nr:CoA transferase [Dehalococcoidia bacterium]